MSNYNGRAKASHVWEWRDDTGPRYVGWGVVNRDGFPWERRWAARANDPSPLGAWLRSLGDVPPALSWQHLPSVALPASSAAAVCRLRRQQLRRLGVKLLASRVYAGSRPMRSVTIAGITYPSLRAAAIATKTPWATFWRRLGGRPAV